MSKFFRFFFKLSIFFFSVFFYTQEATEKYLKYLDAANTSVDNSPKIAEKFLDSIPKPLESSINGRIAEYYHLKAVLSSYLSRQAEIYHYNILCLKYAEKEKNYDLAGAASMELFYNMYIVKKDTTALNYLKKSEKYYTIDNNKLGLVDVMQMQAYIKFYNKKYEESNLLILPKLAYYKSIKEDSFYYMYALFILTSNYIYLKDEENVNRYYNHFKELEKDTTISTLLYKIHDVSLNISLTEMCLNNKQLDSVSFYLAKVDRMHSAMNNSDKENHFKNYVAYFDALNDEKSKNNYLDSLKFLHENLIKENIDASFSINESFLESTKILEAETAKKDVNRNWIIFLVSLLVGILTFVIVKYKSVKKMLLDLSKRTNEYSFLQNNHDKLKLKVKGLENYIAELKKEIKTISSITNIDDQKSRIKELHKEIHHSSSVLLDKGEDHLDLINNLNVEFFNQILTKHPELNSSEVIICYYLFMGFKNKEIGAFINTSVRSVESKRYRITNKLGIKEKGVKLVDYLTETFKQTSNFV
ncbi:helix-turn-helix transcriptional regulator [Polaribacter butkevichii]|uniref:helix-turn-helix transcriptional regulator n=1 Tax=Polaribacter butkevichii TaxID=218490 RepID=UPI001B801B65|nr:hypothetical protein [Polaribacter butkevichii]